MCIFSQMAVRSGDRTPVFIIGSVPCGEFIDVRAAGKLLRLMDEGLHFVVTLSSGAIGIGILLDTDQTDGLICRDPFGFVAALMDGYQGLEWLFVDEDRAVSSISCDLRMKHVGYITRSKEGRAWDLSVNDTYWEVRK